MNARARSAAMAAVTLWQRELQRFFRQPSRVAGAVGTPLIFWLFMGSGLGGSFRLPGASGVSYLQFFFPGTLALVLLFAAIFSTLSVIEDRHEGFLQGVLVAPVGRGAIVAGKVLGGATLAWLQGVVFLLLAPLAGLPLTVHSFLAAAGVLALLAVGLTAIGFGFAWKVDSVQGFHAVMNVVLLPMWLLSGSFFPLAGAPRWLSLLMRINPLTYGIAALRGVIGGGGGDGATVAIPLLPIGITAGMALVAFAVDLFVTRGGRVE
ncbi:MAG TPA: ABC transporter permease [Thermoanaerobaculia bacterium]|nr:ABC transporter permease [Thermoanaerobaculia bacterium]